MLLWAEKSTRTHWLDLWTLLHLNCYYRRISRHGATVKNLAAYLPDFRVLLCSSFYRRFSVSSWYNRDFTESSLFACDELHDEFPHESARMCQAYMSCHHVHSESLLSAVIRWFLKISQFIDRRCRLELTCKTRINFKRSLNSLVNSKYSGPYRQLLSFPQTCEPNIGCDHMDRDSQPNGRTDRRACRRMRAIAFIDSWRRNRCIKRCYVLTSSGKNRQLDRLAGQRSSV